VTILTTSFTAEIRTGIRFQSVTALPSPESRGGVMQIILLKKFLTVFELQLKVSIDIIHTKKRRMTFSSGGTPLRSHCTFITLEWEERVHVHSVVL
jgi:hypothetical protein